MYPFSCKSLILSSCVDWSDASPGMRPTFDFGVCTSFSVIWFTPWHSKCRCSECITATSPMMLAISQKITNYLEAGSKFRNLHVGTNLEIILKLLKAYLVTPSSQVNTEVLLGSSILPQTNWNQQQQNWIMQLQSAQLQEGNTSKQVSVYTRIPHITTRTWQPPAVIRNQ